MGRRPISPWAIRARAAGLDQQTLATLAGVTKNSVYRGLKGCQRAGVPAGLRSVIVAWEIMAHDQRIAWLEILREEGAVTAADAAAP